MYGFGNYMMEETIYTSEGNLISDNVSSYKLPSCGDVPLDWDVELLNYEPSTKEIGLYVFIISLSTISTFARKLARQCFCCLKIYSQVQFERRRRGQRSTGPVCPVRRVGRCACCTSPCWPSAVCPRGISSKRRPHCGCTTNYRTASAAAAYPCTIARLVAAVASVTLNGSSRLSPRRKRSKASASAPLERFRPNKFSPLIAVPRAAETCCRTVLLASTPPLRPRRVHHVV